MPAVDVARRAAAAVRRAPLTTTWLVVLFVTTRIQRSASPRSRRMLLHRHSTNLRHLHNEPTRVLASSLFWLDGRRWWPYVPAYLAVLAPAERRLGWWRWLAVGLAAHALGTYVGQDRLRRAIRSADAPRRLVDARDVGVSYFLLGVLGALTGYVPPPRRSRWQAVLVTGMAGNALINPTHTEIGHLTALLTGLAYAPFVPNRDDAPFAAQSDPFAEPARGQGLR